MTITIKSVIAALITFIVPGLGQLFYGKILWAMFWLVLGAMTGGAANICAAIHILFLEAK